MKTFLYLFCFGLVAYLFCRFLLAINWVLKKITAWSPPKSRGVPSDSLVYRCLRTIAANVLQRSGTTCAVSVLGMLLILLLPAQAQDNQGYPNTQGAITNVPASMVTATSTSLSNNIVVLRNTGLGLQAVFQGSNLVSGPVTLFVFPSLDKTNYWTSPWATVAIPANGTNTVVGGTNWDQLKMRSFQSVSIVISNGTGANIIGFGGAVTNANSAGTNVIPSGAIWNRPNL